VRAGEGGERVGWRRGIGIKESENERERESERETGEGGKWRF